MQKGGGQAEPTFSTRHVRGPEAPPQALSGPLDRAPGLPPRGSVPPLLSTPGSVLSGREVVMAVLLLEPKPGMKEKVKGGGPGPVGSTPRGAASEPGIGYKGTNRD